MKAPQTRTDAEGFVRGNIEGITTFCFAVRMPKMCMSGLGKGQIGRRDSLDETKAPSLAGLSKAWGLNGGLQCYFIWTSPGQDVSGRRP